MIVCKAAAVGWLVFRCCWTCGVARSGGGWKPHNCLETGGRAGQSVPGIRSHQCQSGIQSGSRQVVKVPDQVPGIRKIHCRLTPDTYH